MMQAIKWLCVQRQRVIRRHLEIRVWSSKYSQSSLPWSRCEEVYVLRYSPEHLTIDGQAILNQLNQSRLYSNSGQITIDLIHKPFVYTSAAPAPAASRGPHQSGRERR